MRGFCSKCKEYRSDDGENAWGIVWINETPICEKCGSFVDILDDSEEIYPNDGRPKKWPEITRR
jgi:hypothetical protein